MNPEICRIAVPVPNGYSFHPLIDLMYCVADGNYSWLYFSDGKKYLISRNLRHLEDHLPPGWFLRIHNSYLANKAHITQYTNSSVNCIRMSNGEELEVSRRNQKRLKEQFVIL